MAEKREHHFVPQFYLRKFSNNGRSINLYNFKNKRFVRGASIKGQCSRRNFYGPDTTIENALGKVESQASKVLAKIDADKSLPPQGSEEMVELLTFIALQRGRGISVARINNEQTDTLAKLQFEGDPQFNQNYRDVIEIENVYPALRPLRITAEMLPLIVSLRAHLFINETNIDYVSSDDPIVCHNLFCEGIDYRGVLGMNSSGIKMIFPITPRSLILLYDQSVYAVGKRKKETFSIITKEEEINNLNGFQLLNASNNIYYRSLDHEPYLNGCINYHTPLRHKRRSRVVRTERVTTDEGESELLHMYEPLLESKLKLNDVKIRRNKRRIPLHSRSTLFRYNLPQPQSSPTHKGKGSIRYPVKSVV